MPTYVTLVKWTEQAVKEIKDFATQGNWTEMELVVQVKGSPTQEILEKCFVLGKNLAEAIKK